MKIVGKLKLNKLSESQLEKNELNRLKGGARCCICVSHDNRNSMFNSGSSGSYPSGGGGSGTGSYS